MVGVCFWDGGAAVEGGDEWQRLPYVESHCIPSFKTDPQDSIKKIWFRFRFSMMYKKDTVVSGVPLECWHKRCKIWWIMTASLNVQSTAVKYPISTN